MWWASWGLQKIKIKPKKPQDIPGQTGLGCSNVIASLAARPWASQGGEVLAAGYSWLCRSWAYVAPGSQLELGRGMQPMISICAVTDAQASNFGSGRGSGGGQTMHAVTCGADPSLGGVVEDRLGDFLRDGCRKQCCVGDGCQTVPASSSAPEPAQNLAAGLVLCGRCRSRIEQGELLGQRRERLGYRGAGAA